MISLTRLALPGVLLSAALLAAACGRTEEPPPPPPVVTNPVDPATAGSIRGTITLQGTPPPAEPVNMGSDPYCEMQGPRSTETFVTGENGALQNVFVYVKDGLGDLVFPVPAEPVVLDQQRCR